MARNIVVLVGSLRTQSYNRRLAQALAGLAPPELVLRIAEIGDLPFYNEELEPEPPAAWLRLREAVGGAEGVLFVTPEYNRSVPAVLKNAVDVLSRPHGQGALRGKPAAIITASPGALGGFGANHHLRQALAALAVPVMAAPEAYLGGIATAFDAHGRLVKPELREFLTAFMSAFAGWVQLFAGRG